MLIFTLNILVAQAGKKAKWTTFFSAWIFVFFVCFILIASLQFLSQQALTLSP